MWKCFNRGVWETIDRSVNIFKADTSNGTCLISSLAKDLDDKNEVENLRNKPQPYSEDKFGTCHGSEELNLPREHHARRQIVNKTAKIHDHARTSKVFSRDVCHLKAVTASQFCDNSPAASISEEYNERLCRDRRQPPGIINWCRGRIISEECELRCSYDRGPSTDSGYISESHLVDKSGLYLDESSEPNFKWKLQSQLRENAINVFPEGGRQLQLSSSTLHEACVSKDSFFSLFNRFTLLREGHHVKEEKIISPNEKKYPCNSHHSNSHAKPNCMLKLPFLCYDLGKFKGLNNISACWLMKPRGEFGRGDSGGTGGEQSGESEEKKDDAWRECQMHQSFLEAIGWSSAVLIGWFLGQCRFWNLHGELRRDDNAENKRKCCVIGSLAKLLITWRSDTVLPLKVLPNKTDGISKEYKKKKGSTVYGSENTLINDPYGECPPNQLPVFEREDHKLCDRHSSSNYSILQKTKDTSHKGLLNQKLSSIDGVQKSNAIPMPWHVDSAKNLAYGPITLEEAIKEAGRELEETQAEVLLALALEKLNEGCNSTPNESLPASLFQSAASLGSAAAAFNLGICYEKGVGGVDKNLAQAYHWYEQASQQGHAAATYNLAVFHANGLGGLHANTVLANQLLLKASALGLQEASNALDLISSFNSSEIMSSSEGSSNLPVTPNMPKSSSSEVVKNEQDLMSMCSESYHGSSDDLPLPMMSIGAVSQVSEYFKKASKMSSLKIGHLLMTHGIALNNSFDNSRQLLEEMFDDHPCMENRDADNNLVQLLAH